MSGVGFLIAGLSAFFNGSFPAWAKLSKEEVDPVVFNGTVGLGAFLSSLLVPLIFQTRWLVLPYALIGGVLLIGATLFSFLAISKLGLGIAMAVWSCCAIFVSFIWGVSPIKEFCKPVENWPLTLLSLLCLAAGAVVIVSAKSLAERFLPGNSRTKVDEEAAVAEGEAENGLVDSPGEGANATSAKDSVLGLIYALSVGLFGGSILVPMRFVPKEVNGESVKGLETVISFGLGALCAAVVVTQTYWSCGLKRGGVARVQPRTLLAGILAGTTWNLGNIAQIIVQDKPFTLPYGIAYPLGQCGMLFGGLWGILVFREITGKAVWVFWGGAAILVVGVVLLGAFGPGADPDHQQC